MLTNTVLLGSAIMKILVVYLCTILLQLALSETSKVKKVSVRNLISESLPYPTPWEPMKTKPITEKLEIKQSLFNTEIKNQKHEVSKNHEYESKSYNLSSSLVPAKISPEEKIIHGTTTLKEGNEFDYSKFNLETKYATSESPEKNAPLAGSIISPYSSLILTEQTQENKQTPSQEQPIISYLTSFLQPNLQLSPQVEDETPFQELPILFQPGDSISYPSRSNEVYGLPFLLPPTQSFEKKLSDPSTIKSYPSPLPTLSPQKDQPPSQILMILIPSTELVLDPPEPPKDNVQQTPKPASFLLKSKPKNGFYKSFKEHLPLFSSQSFPPLVPRPSSQESLLLPVIDSVSFPPIISKNSPHNEFLFESATQNFNH